MKIPEVSLVALLSLKLQPDRFVSANKSEIVLPTVAIFLSNVVPFISLTRICV